MRRVSSWASRTSAGEGVRPRPSSLKLHRARSISETIQETRVAEEAGMAENGGDEKEQKEEDEEKRQKSRCRRVMDMFIPPALLTNRSYMTYMCVALFINLGNST